VPNRRTFLRGAAAGAAGLALSPGLAWSQRPIERAPRALRILILGGTNYLGPFQVKYALERGHSISIFNRGRRVPALYPEVFERVEKLEGDRNGDLRSLQGKRWDAVIDNSATDPKWVTDSATALKDSVRNYMYVSSTGVFLPYLRDRIDESVEPRLEDPPGTQQPSYGVQKARSEREAIKVFGDRAVIVRPHFIVGPGDSSDRFPYWPVRIARGGEVLVPGRKSDLVQYIDVRDLTEWMIRMLETGDGGVYNLAGPEGGITMEEFVHGVRAATTKPASWVWADDYDFLTRNEIGGAVPWIRLTGDNQYMTSIVFDRALAKGLTFRPLATTVVDMLAWWHSSAVPEQRRQSPRFVFTPERERELIQAWKAASG
jgi:2'-hydroxyisoflavone reductase